MFPSSRRFLPFLLCILLAPHTDGLGKEVQAYRLAARVEPNQITGVSASRRADGVSSLLSRGPLLGSMVKPADERSGQDNEEALAPASIKCYIQGFFLLMFPPLGRQKMKRKKTDSERAVSVQMLHVVPDACVYSTRRFT